MVGYNNFNIPNMRFAITLLYFTLLDTAVVRLFAFQPVVSRRCSCFNIVAQVTLYISRC